MRGIRRGVAVVHTLSAPAREEEEFGLGHGGRGIDRGTHLDCLSASSAPFLIACSFVYLTVRFRKSGCGAKGGHRQVSRDYRV